MLLQYMEGAIKNAEYKKLEDGTWFAKIPGFQGVWANGKTIEECRNELFEVLEEWILLKIRDDESVPVVDGIKLSIKKVAG